MYKLLKMDMEHLVNVRKKNFTATDLEGKRVPWWRYQERSLPTAKEDQNLQVLNQATQKTQNIQNEIQSAQ